MTIGALDFAYKLCLGEQVMRALSGPTFDLATFLPASTEDEGVSPRRSVGVKRGRDKMIVGFYSVFAPVATVAWLAALTWAAIKVVGYALS